MVLWYFLNAIGRDPHSYAMALFSAFWHGEWESSHCQNVFQYVLLSSAIQKLTLELRLCVCVRMRGKRWVSKHTLTLSHPLQLLHLCSDGLHVPPADAYTHSCSTSSHLEQSISH